MTTATHYLARAKEAAAKGDVLAAGRLAITAEWEARADGEWATVREAEQFLDTLPKTA